MSTACSIGVFGTQFGVALGYIIPPMVVKYSEDVNEIGDGLTILCWTLTASMVPVALAILLCK